MSKNLDLTEGSVTKKLITFALPLLISSIIQLMYNTVDMIFIGRFIDSSAAAAVGASSMIINCIVALSTGLSIGVGVAAAKAVGCKHYERLHQIVHSAATITIIISVVLTSFGIIFAPQLLRAMNTPEEILDLAVSYLRIYMVSFFAIVSYNTGTGLLKALGNSRSPMFYQLGGGLTNIGANFLFICVLNMGVVGAGIATLLSQTMATVLTLRHLLKFPDEYKLHIRHMALYKGVTREILMVGIPAAVQGMVLSFSNILVQTNINGLGVDSIAAFAAYYKIENFIYLPIMAVSQACATFTGQNYGAGNAQRIKQGTRSSILIGLVVVVSLSLVGIFASDLIYSVFNSDPNVIALGSRIIHVTFPFYFLYVFLEVFSSTIRGSGKGLPTMMITVINMCVLRTIILVLLTRVIPGVEGIAWVYPITWVCSAFCMFMYYKSARWKRGMATYCKTGEVIE